MRRFIPAASLAAIVATGMSATVWAGSGSSSGSSTATIQQSGPGGTSTVTRSTNGSQTITRRSGNSTATITQGDGPAANRAADAIEDKAAARLGCGRRGAAREGGGRAASAAAAAGIDLCDPEDDRAAAIPIPTPRPDRSPAAPVARAASAEALERRMDPDGRLRALDARARAMGVDLGAERALRRIVREAAN